MAQRPSHETLDPHLIRANFSRVKDEVAAACSRASRAPAEVEILVATKYVTTEGMESLAQAGIILVGENRAQDLAAKQALYGDRFTWDFIGHLQSNKVRQILPLTRMIHSVESLSAAGEIDRRAQAPIDVLLEVNVGGEAGKYGIIPTEVDRFLEEASRYPKVNFAGLMTMPPLAADPEAVRPHFAALRRLQSQLNQKWSGSHDFRHLSMGTSGDYVVAVEEGATIIRVGSVVFG
ncbi:MAG: YggS family pyridoxal phosphate-dependent enzyme [Thermoleophilia bacterium]|nr:YggS family pyridoxal phosphate-dependent enzyme [Thermoleophilia bacterium]